MDSRRKNNINRRNFVKISSAVGMGFAISGTCPAHAQEQENDPKKKFNLDYAKWWVDTLLNKLGRDKKLNCGSEVLEECGRECAKRFTANALPGVKKKVNSLTDLDDIIDCLKRERILTSASTRDGDRIICVYETCPCPVRQSGMVKAAEICHCSKGFKMHVFETLMDRPVTVDLIKSIGRGDDRCEIAVRLG